MIAIPRHITESVQHMEDIYSAIRKAQITFSKSQAMKIVGGRTRLERLAATKKIRVNVRGGNYRMGQWECNGEDVLRYALDK